ncbi:MAG: prepilin-type N-terminal cleavage/methylation domain-containing protein [Candidatus Krumholzibacteriaceae bacterium]|jgi:prepilin-type N-terminal cleavage/methylation domain-containing protein
MKKRFTLAKGFTLVEMVVAISILGLIIAIGTPPVVRYLHHFQARDAAQVVAGVLRQARERAIHERNNYVVFFNVGGSSITVLDDDGGGSGNPANAGFVATNRGNGVADNGERVYGPYRLPKGQVFGLVGGTVGPDGTYVQSAVTFSGTPPRVVFYPNGSTNEEGIVVVMPEGEFRIQHRGADQMLIVRRSTGSVVQARPSYN